MKLNLGSCDREVAGFLSVDIVPPANIIADLAHPWPWPDSSVDEVVAYDVIEHIGDCDHVRTFCVRCLLHNQSISADSRMPEWMGNRARHPLGRIHFMNELHRVLVPGGIARIETPNASRGAGFFQDPTHVTPWCMNSFQYFEAGSFATQRLAQSYGITARFRINSLTEREYQDAYEIVWKITAVLEAVK